MLKLNKLIENNDTNVKLAAQTLIYLFYLLICWFVYHSLFTAIDKQKQRKIDPKFCVVCFLCNGFISSFINYMSSEDVTFCCIKLHYY